jgi:hypothetical protein
MKNYNLLLAFFILLVGCKNDNAEPIQIEPITLNFAKVTVDEKYLELLPNGDLADGKVFISNQDGEVIVEKNIDNGGQYSLFTEVNDSSEINSYDFSLAFFLQEENRISGFIETYINVKDAEINLKRASVNNNIINPYYLTIKTENYLTPNIMSDVGYFIESNSENELKIRFNMRPNDENLYFLLTGEDGTRRYFFKENIQSGQSDTIDFNFMEEAEHKLDFDLPNISGFEFKAYGKKDDTSLDKYEVYKFGLHNQNQSNKLFLPMNLFNTFQTLAWYNADGRKYTLFKEVQELEGNIDLSEIQGEYFGNSPIDFLLASNSDYSYYKIKFKLIKINPTGVSHIFDWSIYGESSQAVEVNLPNILGKIGLEDLDTEEFEISNVTIEKVSGISSYSDYINCHTNSDINIFDIAETVERIEW